MKPQPQKLAFVYFVLVICGCLNDADRNNPLDPASPNFKNTGGISGQTLSFYSPFSPIADVEVRLDPGPLLTTSDAQGRFSFANLLAAAYQIRASKDGYAAVFDTVEVPLQQLAQISLNLDALPVITNPRVSSSHISRWWPQTDLYLLAANVRVEDLDGVNDIATIELLIPDLSFVDTLSMTAAPGVFQIQVLESQLPGRNLQEVLGREILIRAKDRAGFNSTSAPQFIARIIEEVPITLSPQGLETVATANPTLQWQALNQPYRFTYRVELYRVDFGINNLVWQRGEIDRATTEIIVPENLTPGTYFWTIAVVDEFGNLSRSKEASFQVN